MPMAAPAAVRMHRHHASSPSNFAPPEQPQGAVRPRVGLHALKAARAVVQHLSSGMHRQRAKRHDAWNIPAAGSGVLDQQHMVGEGFAKRQLLRYSGVGGGVGGGVSSMQHRRSQGVV